MELTTKSEEDVPLQNIINMASITNEIKTHSWNHQFSDKQEKSIQRNLTNVDKILAQHMNGLARSEKT